MFTLRLTLFPKDVDQRTFSSENMIVLTGDGLRRLLDAFSGRSGNNDRLEIVLSDEVLRMYRDPATAAT
jgi:hypothetical protein